VLSVGCTTFQDTPSDAVPITGLGVSAVADDPAGAMVDEQGVPAPSRTDVYIWTRFPRVLIPAFLRGPKAAR
jgi:hypothetical protein